ncbi:MAG: CbtA family protein, partial [Nitrososphaeraceae archaeon]
MKTFIFIIITLLSEAIAGTLLGLINQAIVEPFIDEAIGIETQNMISEGENVDLQEIGNIRLWQKEGEIVSGTLLGT